MDKEPGGGGGGGWAMVQEVQKNHKTSQLNNSTSATLCQTDAALWSFKIELCGSLVLRSMNKVWVGT